VPLNGPKRWALTRSSLRMARWDQPRQFDIILRPQIIRQKDTFSLPFVSRFGAAGTCKKYQ
jgi:hypothetical protein